MRDFYLQVCFTSGTENNLKWTTYRGWSEENNTMSDALDASVAAFVRFSNH